LQQYADQKLPPRSDILIKLARGANVSIDWLATGQGETRAAGQLLGATFADVAMDRTARDPCCNDRPFFLTAPFDQVRISRAAKFLLGHGCGIVTGCVKYRNQGLSKILVEFKLQWLASVGISTNRSRAISAPYAMQARTSASSRPG
jgi:hypothetical protein